ncbi:hypothetical protein M9H77_27943 [Catharanthus roseus]|uniref:Uncharacterized protein n=1 Tax=Catharanthus roseus TaxID=4058 RepID=A0ACC0AFU1_CATRO|nr:hypothetical protein M9H77_27943 [Catharanthus roseus]
MGLKNEKNIRNMCGSWGICYTYGTWFAVEGLVACRKTYQNSSAFQFLLSNNYLMEFGERVTIKIFTNLEGNKSNMVRSSWALLSLIDAGQVSLHHKDYFTSLRHICITFK